MTMRTGEAFITRESIGIWLCALRAAAEIGLAEGSYLKTVAEGNDRIVIFSDALPKLAYVDASDRVEQLTPALRAALLSLRRESELSIRGSRLTGKRFGCHLTDR